MNQQEQLRLLSEAMNSHKKAEAVASENGRLTELLASRQLTLKRLQQLTLAASALVSSVDSSTTETEPSSLQCLVKLDQSTAIVPIEEEKVEDSAKVITGKYLNQLLATVVSALDQTQGNPSIVSFLKLELSLHQSYNFAEQNQLIPVTDENRSWKKGMKSHEKLFALLQGAAGGEGEGDDDDE
jgi:hypothetical protein